MSHLGDRQPPIRNPMSTVVRADEGLRWMYAFWFAWYAFYPETEIFAAPSWKASELLVTHPITR